MEICPAVTVVGEGGFVSGGEEAASALYYKGRRRAEGTLPAEKGCYGRALSGRAPGGRWRRGRRHTPTSIPAIVSAAQPSSSFDDHDARMVHCGEGETKKRRRLHYRETETTLNDHEEEATDIGRWLLRLSPEEIYHLQRQGRCYVQNVRVGASLLDAMSSNVSRASLRTRIEVYDSLRRRGWVVRHGCKFGAHYVLYRSDPSMAHARATVTICPRSSVPSGAATVAAATANTTRMICGRRSGPNAADMRSGEPQSRLSEENEVDNATKKEKTMPEQQPIHVRKTKEESMALPGGWTTLVGIGRISFGVLKDIVLVEASDAASQPEGGNMKGKGPVRLSGVNVRRWVPRCESEAKKKKQRRVALQQAGKGRGKRRGKGKRKGSTAENVQLKRNKSDAK